MGINVTYNPDPRIAGEAAYSVGYGEAAARLAAARQQAQLQMAQLSARRRSEQDQVQAQAERDQRLADIKAQQDQRDFAQQKDMLGLQQKFKSQEDTANDQRTRDSWNAQMDRVDAQNQAMAARQEAAAQAKAQQEQQDQAAKDRSKRVDFIMKDPSAIGLRKQWNALQQGRQVVQDEYGDNPGIFKEMNDKINQQENQLLQQAPAPQTEMEQMKDAYPELNLQPGGFYNAPNGVLMQKTRDPKTGAYHDVPIVDKEGIEKNKLAENDKKRQEDIKNKADAKFQQRSDAWHTRYDNMVSSLAKDDAKRSDQGLAPRFKSDDEMQQYVMKMLAPSKPTMKGVLDEEMQGGAPTAAQTGFVERTLPMQQQIQNALRFDVKNGRLNQDKAMELNEATTKGIPLLQDPSEADQLEPGTFFVTPDGRLKRVPLNPSI